MVNENDMPDAIKNYQRPRSTKLYRIYDPSTRQLIQELLEDEGCWGAQHGPNSERCGGCTSCLVMQSQHYGYIVEEVEIKHS